MGKKWHHLHLDCFLINLTFTGQRCLQPGTKSAGKMKPDWSSSHVQFIDEMNE